MGDQQNFRYDKDYFEGGKLSNYKSYKCVMMMMKKFYFPKVLKDVSLGVGSKVLDIGCAYGYFLKSCDEIGCATYGIDISEYAILQAKKETKAKLYAHDVGKGLQMFSDNLFDCVVMFDVIEHLQSPSHILTEAHRILKPNGKIVITTPNLNTIVRIILKLLGKEKEWCGFYDKTHIYQFTPLSLRFSVERAGFKVIKLEIPIHALPKIIQKITNKTNLGDQIWLVGKK